MFCGYSFSLMENNTDILLPQLTARLNILDPNKIYQDSDGKLKLDKATPYKTVEINGVHVDNPDLTKEELEHVEENHQPWIIARLISRIADQDYLLKKDED
jgi:hypothetical protein|tara:strand:+ start:2280 stop:2582 length:303 start_codon:yes stop_codon:yes gene_type:complete